MPKVLAQGKTIECEKKANLRKVLLHNGIDLYNGGASFINCRGIGSCGTCAVKVEPEVSAANWRSKCTAIASSPFSYIKPT
jgi:ferredoxin